MVGKVPPEPQVIEATVLPLKERVSVPLLACEPETVSVLGVAEGLLKA
jgi:hypothetical protein